MIPLKFTFIYLLFGIILGIINDNLNFLKIIFKRQKIITAFIEGIFAVSIVFCFFLLTIKINFGIIRLYFIIISLAGYILENKTLGYLIAKFYNWVYNKICKILNKFKNNILVKRVLK